MTPVTLKYMGVKNDKYSQDVVTLYDELIEPYLDVFSLFGKLMNSNEIAAMHKLAKEGSDDPNVKNIAEASIKFETAVSDAWREYRSAMAKYENN